MTPRELQKELEFRHANIVTTARSLPIDPMFVSGYGRAVADLRRLVEDDAMGPAPVTLGFFGPQQTPEGQ